jgi:hypothetical protein
MPPETGRFLSERDRLNQAAADAAYGADPGGLYRVALPDVADVILPARDEDQAKARFNKLMGVTGTTATYVVQRVEQPQSSALPEPLPADGKPPP